MAFPRQLLAAERLVALAAVFLFTGWAPLHAQQIPLEERTFNEKVLRASGQPVIPLFDGWYDNPDGSKSICFGYKNLNLEESLEIPLGPDNAIEPRELDGAQPTHFDPAPETFDPDSDMTQYRRHWCVFTVRVPEDFGQQRVVWTLRIRGDTLSTPGHLHPDYVLDEPASDGRGEVAPLLKLGDDGPEARGRNGVTAGPRRVAVGEPLPLSVSVEHTAERTWVGWYKHQGPGEVTFGEAELWVERPDGKATTMARFDAPGEYLLRVQTIDDPVDDFEFFCCWTNGFVQVNVGR